MPTSASGSSATTARVAASISSRQRRAVGVAQRHVLGARVAAAARRQRSAYARSSRAAVEEVLGVVDHALALADQERDRLGDHAQVLVAVDLARPSRGAGPRSCRRACRPARRTRRARAAPGPRRRRRRAGASSRTPRRRARRPGVSSRSNSSASFGFEVGKPASIIGTPRSSRRCATRTFSSTDSDMPSPCIPSRRVRVVDDDRAHGVGAGTRHHVQPLGVALRAAVQRVLEDRLDRARDLGPARRCRPAGRRPRGSASARRRCRS